MHPNKLFLIIIAVITYVWLTIRLLFVEVPVLLREADTATNGAAILAVIVWLLVTLYVPYTYWFRKQSKLKKKD